jgi:hypothetical protein
MALSGSLNFVSASITGSDNINVDFVGLNTLIIDPITSSTNILGQPATTNPEIYYNSEVEGQGDVQEPNYFNSLLLHRNGPYQHPSWKQYRTADHPVARTLRLNNTMSIDAAYANAKEREEEKRFLRHRLENDNHKEVNDYFQLTNDQLKNSNTSNPKLYRNESLQRYYEPSVLKAHKPFIYEIGGAFKVRSTLMNQMVFFENEEINHAMNIAGADRYTSSFSGAPISRPKQEYYNFIAAAKENGATAFIYSETIFPRPINTFRPYKLEKPSYEEDNQAAIRANSFNSVDNRSFWRNSQPALARGIAPGANNRNRGVNKALNSQNVLQTFNGPRKIRVEANLNLISDNGGLGGSRDLWQYTYNFMEPGIVLHSAVNTTTGAAGVGGPTGSFVVQEAYQPYPLTLLSMWPLDARPDLYNSPVYLTSSHGGFGAHVGLTPHRMFEQAGGRSSIALTYTLTDSPVFTGSADAARGSTASVLGGAHFLVPDTGLAYQVHDTVTGSTAQYIRLATGSAGELVYSTKPTMFFHKTGSETLDIKGYRVQTASLQYNRHTFPYNTPFYATNRVRGRNPFYNSYADFTQDMKYVGRDYSFVPEYKTSRNIKYYYENLLSNADLDQKIYTLNEDNKFVRTVGFSASKQVKDFKLNFLTLDGAFETSSAGTISLSGSSESAVARKYIPLTKTTSVSTLKDELGYADDRKAFSHLIDSRGVIFNEAFSHTDTGQVSNLMAEPFDNAANTIPAKIKFIAYGLKKLRPEKNFYPVTKTVDVGSKFKDFVYNALDSDLQPQYGDGQNVDYIEQGGQINGKLQSFLEPFFAPGILYNSIKSGIAVDYPVYDSGPTYFAPWLYFSGSKDGDSVRINRSEGPTRGFVRPNNKQRFTEKITSSFNYGGFYMLGASRCIPAILNSPPTFRMPFEALYDTERLINRFSIKDGREAKKLHLTTDFLDLDINQPSIAAATTASATYLSAGGTVLEHPGAASTRTGPVGRLDSDKIRPVDKFLYESSVNNFLCETMDFFLKDQDGNTGVKLPVIMSEHKQDSDIELSANKFYGMQLSLKMGRDQILCEGPRHAGVGGPKRSVDNIYTTNSTMRGYVFGPPIEVVRMTGITTQIYSETLDAAGNITRTEPFIATDVGRHLTNGSASYTATGDYESYFGANLQDPAYQTYTPPYFYGKSSIVVGAQSTNKITTWTDLFSETDNDSYYLENYVTGSDFSSLCVAPPGTGSVSGYFSTRMKIDRSVDVFQRAQIEYSKTGTDEKQDASIWYINPKWVCPVLDFSSSFSAVTTNERRGLLNDVLETVSYVTNSYHGVKTGRGLWGGYGIDPYDSVVVNEVANLEGNTNIDKGITLSLSSLLDSSADVKESAAAYDFGTFNASSGFKVAKPSSTTAATSGSLAEQLGFDKQVNKKIGQISDSKHVSEALMIVPYFDKPIEARNGEEEVFVTREIIPGKYFLPIQNKVFENILSMAVAEKQNEGEIPEGFFGAGDTSYKNTSVYKMIHMLMEDEARSHAGYELPPEFDFVNYNVLPFQALVIPFEHELKKQELIDIYQGIMPESSLVFEKVTSALELEMDSTTYGDETPWLPSGLGPINPGNFLDPSYINSGLVGATCNNWINSSREFYKNLKFMIFKVKQKGNKNYKNYKNKQIHKSILNRVSGDKSISNLKVKGFDTDKTLRDVFGYNWPYDDFSLIESFKLDIEVEVQE